MLEKDDAIGDYKLRKFLGRGQFGEVWLAEKQLQFSTRKVRHALKFLINAGDDIDLKAAEAEIDTWIEASGHPNVMSVIDMHLYRGYVVIISEFAEGGSLKGWLAENGGKAPTVVKGLEMLVGILHGIEHLHSKNVVHRDLKPDNILLQGNFPRITDFGISRIVSSGSMSTKAMGSPAYMSPESFNGSKSPQNDIWSAGVILYEMLTGSYPFSAETIYGLVNAIQVEEVRPLPVTVLRELREIVAAALQKDPKKRYQTAKEMRRAIENVIYQLKAGNSPELVTSQESNEIAKTIPAVQFDHFEPVQLVNQEQTETIPAFQTDGEPESNVVTTKFSETLESSDEMTQNAFVEIPSLIEGLSSSDYINDPDLERIRQEIKIKNELKEQTKINNHDTGKKGVFTSLAGLGVFIVFCSIAGWLAFLYFSPGDSISKLSNSTLSDVKQTKSNTPARVTGDQTPSPPTGMAFVPGGEFMMGRDDGISDAEKPAHKVTVQPFFMDIYETTNEQYAAFVGATDHKPPTDWKDGAFPKGQAKFPVVGINWEDANAFAKWANKRLPTDEEWEFAARGMADFVYPWGNEWQAGKANVGNQSFSDVGKFKGTSPFGIFDLVGNAWEWTASDFRAYQGGKLPDVFYGKTNLKTIRGGSYEATKDFATTTYRIGWAPTGAETYNRTGFRCVKDIEK